MDGDQNLDEEEETIFDSEIDDAISETNLDAESDTEMDPIKPSGEAKNNYQGLYSSILDIQDAKTLLDVLNEEVQSVARINHLIVF